MKFFSSILFAFFALATVVFAQDVQILFPLPNTKVKPGEKLIVEIAQPVGSSSGFSHTYTCLTLHRTVLKVR